MNRVAKIATRHWKALLGLNAILFAATIGIAVSTPRVWTAKMAFILPTTTSDLNANLGTLGNLSNGSIGFSKELNPLKTQSSILLSNGLLRQVWAADPEKSLYPTLGSYKALFSVSPQSESTIISLDVNGSSPERAKLRTVAFAGAYQQRLAELRKDDDAARERLKRGELERARRNLHQAQAALAEFKRSSGLIDSEEQTKGMVAAVNNLRAVQVQALAQAQSNQERVKKLSDRIGLSSDQAIRSLSLSENQDYQFTRQKLSEVEAALVESQARFSEGHPRVQFLLSQRNELHRQLEWHIARAAGNSVGVDTTVDSKSNGGRQALIQELILAETESNAQQRQATELQSEIDNLSAALKSIPANQAQMLELQRQYDIAEGVYKGLVAQVEEMKLNAFRTYPSVQVLDQPTVDPSPASPNLKLLALGAIIASAFGSFGLALLLEDRNPLLSPKDLQGIVFPVVIHIPRLKRTVMELAWGAEAEVEFQQLASSVSLLSPKNRSLIVTSSTFGEGKTTVTVGLAAALVDLGFRVLMVDGDFRQAQLSQRLGYSQENSSPTLIHLRPGLDLVPNLSKQDKIVEFVAQGHFKHGVESFQSSNDYDFVLVDSAPVGLTSETSLMSAAIPNVLFVVRPGTSSRNSVIDSLERLVQSKAQLMGLVINGTEVQNQGYGRQLYTSQASLQPDAQLKPVPLEKNREGV
jgi:uncharacterized protein involved in exopolysaccharide biosynthesis/Mrp family chromosome partitioning ATPase